MKQKFIVVLFLLSAIPYFAMGQTSKATAKLDSTKILIGDYLKVHLEIATPKGTSIIFPKINAQTFEEIETPFDWIENSKIDTLLTQDLQIFKQTITITAFDSGHYIIPSIPIFTVDSQLLAESNLLEFTVTTIAVDTTAAYKDIKGNLTTPLSLHEIWLYFKKYGFLILILTALTGMIIYMIIKYYSKRKKKSVVQTVKQAPKIKPHITALKALENLRKKKLWEQGKVKEYYSELTEIIRIYLEDRWEVYAMEMVSSEILDALRSLEINEQDLDQLNKLFSISDLVKFAKWDPLPTDHDMAFKSAKEFIEKTGQTKEASSTNNNQL